MRLAPYLLFASWALCAHAQEALRQEIRAIAIEAQGKVSVACSLRGSTLNCDVNPNAQPPMQSVFKLPLALYVLHQVEQGRLSLDQPVRFLPKDRILPHVYSPLQKQCPDAGVDVSLRELLRLTVSLSDNVAADILLRLAGGPKVVNTYIFSLGVHGFHLQDNEAVLHREMRAQYRNWFEPAGAVQLLRRISDDSPLTREHTDLLLAWMTPSNRAGRLDGDLPSDVHVAHKSGTSDVDDGVAHATNDIGLIPLPDGRRIAVAVFVTDSTAEQDTREQVIARIAKAAYDAALVSKSGKNISGSPLLESPVLTIFYAAYSFTRRYIHGSFKLSSGVFGCTVQYSTSNGPESVRRMHYPIGAQPL
jgi:beta-lactamase class A